MKKDRAELNTESKKEEVFKEEVAANVIYLTTLKHLIEDKLDYYKKLWKEKNWGDFTLKEDGPAIKVTTRVSVKLDPKGVLNFYRANPNVFASTCGTKSEEEFLSTFFDVKPEALPVLEEVKKALGLEPSIEEVIREKVEKKVINVVNLEKVDEAKVTSYALSSVLSEESFALFKKQKEEVNLKREEFLKRKKSNDKKVAAKVPSK